MKPDKCFFTGLPTESMGEIIDGYFYSIKINKQDLIFRLASNFDDLVKSQFFLNKKHIFAGLIFNNKVKIVPPNIILYENLEKAEKEYDYPISPKDKLNNLFSTLYNFQHFEGENIEIYSKILDPIFYYKHYFKKADECFYYLNVLEEQGLINGLEKSGSEHLKSLITRYSITYKGVNEYIKLTEEGEHSNKCFVAMSFSNSTTDIRQAIKESCAKTNFNPILIDEVHFESSQTINDAIISNLKKCKFCIADFTEQKDGVYFESGFALGREMKVIYSCRNDWFEKSHFDTNHFPHIRYETTEELKLKLIDKIEAWIK